eukprot:TRINITY_DN96539_c0_g1_i1.p1 TRINITY_DN96539_c0_g1~~TRINITY_DN96539_c0_g1_i1.p1  ORF type:complete len:649 (+),score=126.38 TRINITY_DN96539_c0_g1_i1:55-2001(+)
MPAPGTAKLLQGSVDALGHQVKRLEELMEKQMQQTSTLISQAHGGDDSDDEETSDAFSRLLSTLASQHRKDVASARRSGPSRHKVSTPPHMGDVPLLRDQELADAEPAAMATPGGALWHSRRGVTFMEPEEQTQIQIPLPNSVPGDANFLEGRPSSLIVEDADLSDEIPGDDGIVDSGKKLSKQPSLKSRKSFMQASMLARSTTQVKKKETKKQVDEETSFTGLAAFVRTPCFDYISSTVLIANALFIGVQVQFDYAESVPDSITWVDYSFSLLFVLELGMRLYGFGCHLFWVTSPERSWNWFDFGIVSFSTVDTILNIALAGESSALANISVLRMIRIVRITRVLRIIRVMKSFKDLRILLGAIASTLKTGVYAFVLILAAMWMFAIAIAQMVAQYRAELKKQGKDISEDLEFFYGSLFKAILSLYMTISGGVDWRDAAMPLLDVNPLAFAMFLFYTLIMSLCVLNVLTGIFCQAAIESAAADQENIIEFQLFEKQRYVETLEKLFSDFDDDLNGKCSLQEFETHLSNSTMQALLRSLEIEVRDALTLFELLDTDGTGEIDLDEFVTGCITLRGGAKAVHMEKMQALAKHIDKLMITVDEKLETLVSAVCPTTKDEKKRPSNQSETSGTSGGLEAGVRLLQTKRNSR